jgi:predicted Zn-dependent peptidase
VLVERPLSPQSELRVGHGAPGRATPAYHALVTVNAILVGQFSSLLNANLRETRGYTYGARSSFDLRRTGGTFACDTSVQADATAAAIVEILRECEGVRLDGAIGGDELARAKAALTRGYARNFETAEQIVRAAVQLATFGLADRTFDEFVPGITQVDASEAVRTAQQHIQPDQCAIVVVGDVQSYRRGVEALGRPVHELVPEF